MVLGINFLFFTIAYRAGHGLLEAPPPAITPAGVEGRGLRLPYGQRTGVDSVDRLCIVAQDRFQEIVDRAKDKNSIIHQTLYIGGTGDGDVPSKQPHVFTTGSTADILTTGRLPEQDGVAVRDTNIGQYSLTPVDKQASQMAEWVMQAIHQESTSLTSSKALNDPQVQRRLVEHVRHQITASVSPQQALPGISDEEENILTDEDILKSVVSVTEKFVELTIDIPQNVILPTREVNYHFDDFDLANLEAINLQPFSQELLVRHLEDDKQTRIQWDSNDIRVERMEDYIVNQLMARDEVDYEKHAELLYKLSGQVVNRVRSYLADATKIENVLAYWQRQLGDFVWSQMNKHLAITPTDYIGKVTQGFDVLRPITFSLGTGESPRDFRMPVDDKRAIRQMLFKGFQKCCYPYQRFQSVEGEWRLANILEDDPAVTKWMKPAPGQFLIEYQNGKKYEPDFVVETENECLILEPKRADQIPLAETQAKASATRRWCEFANQHAAATNSKKWRYALIPDDAIQLGRSLNGLLAEFMIN